MNTATCRSICLVVAVLLAALSPPTPAHAQIEDSEQAGHAAHAKQDYEQASIYYSLAIREQEERPKRTDEQYANLYFMRGLSLFMLRKSDLAIDDFSKALDLTPQSNDASNRIARAFILNLRSQSFLETDKPGSALKDIDFAIELAPHVSAYRRQRAITLFGMDRHNEALADLNVAIGTASGDSFLYAFRGAVHDRLGNADKAEEDFDLAAKMDQDGAEWVKKFRPKK